MKWCLKKLLIQICSFNKYLYQFIYIYYYELTFSKTIFFLYFKDNICNNITYNILQSKNIYFHEKKKEKKDSSLKQCLIYIYK